jgi:hypothetical protein
MSTMPTLHTLQELTDRYGWSKDTLYDYIDRGLLPASKIGRSYFVTPDDIAVLLANTATQPRT